jgi:hypothetical protein
MPSVVHAVMVFFEVLFFAGSIGSLIVVIISGVEDLATIFEKDTGGPAASIGGDHELR